MIEVYKEWYMAVTSYYLNLPDWVFYAGFCVTIIAVGSLAIWAAVKFGHALVKR